MTNRVYLDWNATAPLRPEARAAMLAAMDAVGNPSSVHAEGREAKAMVEKARGQVARLVGCEPGEVVFTSGATEAVTMARPYGAEICWPVEHDCVWDRFGVYGTVPDLDRSGRIRLTVNGHPYNVCPSVDLIAVVAAQSETGVVQPLDLAHELNLSGGRNAEVMSDVVQLAGRMAFDFSSSGLRFALVSAHKLGGPKGTGALIAQGGEVGESYRYSGGQETGRRSGTENVIGIAGFGAAAEAAQRDLEDGVWDRVAKLRDDLEKRLAAEAPDLIVFGKEAPRLPNTSCFAVPGWKGETQVMQMDLAGYAISAGSACSSGKVGPSRVLLAMGFDEVTAASAIRVSMGPTTTEAEVTGFADTWTEHYRRRKSRAA